MTQKTPTRFSALADPFYAAVNAVVSPVARMTSDYCKQAAIYNLNLDPDATWKDVRQEVSSRVFGSTPSNIM